MRKTKIICTLGPAVDSEGMIELLIQNGMDCARLNFSHGDHEEQKRRVEMVRRVGDRLGRHIAILLDTKGPEIRLLSFAEGSAQLQTGQTFVLTPNACQGDGSRVGITYKHLAQFVNQGTRILIDDGKIELEVLRLEQEDVVCQVINGGKVSDHKSVNIPNVQIDMPYLSETDRRDIRFGVEQQVDFIAASFVRSPDDVRELKDYLKECGGKSIQCVSKIENMQGIHHFDEILDLSDGIMVARGDMGVEVPYQLLPAIQKQLIDRCYQRGKFVVTATQMLESMTQCPRPTRAEISDVANAIYDGTTAIMLSGETAAGRYPIEAVTTMSEIALSTEQSIDYREMFAAKQLHLKNDFPNTIAIAACDAAHNLGAKAILVVTRSGKTADLISKYRPACDVIATVVDAQGLRQLQLAWGVTPIEACEQATHEQLLKYSIDRAVSAGKIEKGDTIVLVSGTDLTLDKSSDMLKLCVVE